MRHTRGGLAIYPQKSLQKVAKWYPVKIKLLQKSTPDRLINTHSGRLANLTPAF